MKKVVLITSFITLAVMGIFWGVSFNNSLAQEQGQVKYTSFNGVIPFFTTGEYIGFFDQKDGMLYFYDDQLKKCLFKYKLEQLGEPGVDMSGRASSSTTAASTIYGQPLQGVLLEEVQGLTTQETAESEPEEAGTETPGE